MAMRLGLGDERNTISSTFYLVTGDRFGRRQTVGEKCVHPHAHGHKCRISHSPGKSCSCSSCKYANVECWLFLGVALSSLNSVWWLMIIIRRLSVDDRGCCVDSTRNKSPFNGWRWFGSWDDIVHSFATTNDRHKLSSSIGTCTHLR